MRIPSISALVIAALVQSQPNFSGTWTLAGVNDQPIDAASKPLVVVVTQTERNIELRTGDQTLAVVLGGAETIIQNSGPSGPVDVTIRARLVGGRLVVEQRTATTFIVQTASLSDDGRELTVETLAHTPQGERREKQRFKKSPGY